MTFTIIIGQGCGYVIRGSFVRSQSLGSTKLVRCPGPLMGGCFNCNFNSCHSQCPLQRGCPQVGGGSVTGGSTVRYLAANLIDIKYLPAAHLLECFSVARQCSHTTSTATAMNTQRVGMQHEPASTLTKRTFNNFSQHVLIRVKQIVVLLQLSIQQVLEVYFNFIDCVL